MLSNTLKSTLSAALFITGCVTASASAEEPEKNFIYASYFACPGKMSDATKVIKEGLAPLYDAAVKDGTIKSWGWSTHHTGGKWRLIFNYTSDNVDDLLKAGDIMYERGETAKVDPDNTYGKACNSHDDYIWEITQGADGDIEGPAALSTYFQCNISTEDRADKIIKKHFAPIYNANMGKGKLTSWAWASHVYGGKYRRGIWTSAENYTDLLKTMDDIFEAAYGDNNKNGREFAKICSSHTDYLWNRH